MVDQHGLLHTARTDLSDAQRVYAQPHEIVSNWSGLALHDVIRNIDATVLIGLSTVGGAFTEPIVREMARKTERPVFLPLSNPTARSEAAPADLLRWTDGRTVVATGSPYPPVDFGGRRIRIAQCNNVHIFPALGLGLVASRTNRVTDGMMLAAARTLGENSPAAKDPAAPLLPELRDVRRVAREIAIAVGLEAQRAGVAPLIPETELRERVAAAQWTPHYPSESALQ
jgi:malate dehydrogenase (oxaloacetate-decarboxylating)